MHIYSIFQGCQRHVFDLSVLRNYLNLLNIPIYRGQSYFSNMASHIKKHQQKLLCYEFQILFLSIWYRVLTHTMHYICIVYMYMYIVYVTHTMHCTIPVTAEHESGPREPRCLCALWNSGRHRVGGRGSLDICYSETGYPTIPVIGHLGFSPF